MNFGIVNSMDLANYDRPTKFTKDNLYKTCVMVLEDILILELVFSMRALGNKIKRAEEANR